MLFLESHCGQETLEIIRGDASYTFSIHSFNEATNLFVSELAPIAFDELLNAFTCNIARPVTEKLKDSLGVEVI